MAEILSLEDEDTRLARARVGNLLRDRWRLDELLGVGGMAAVYAATHRNGKRVAVKMLHASLAHNTEVRQRFVDEGYIANRVQHRGVASVLDDDIVDDGAPFLVMDLLDGETLDVLLEREGLLKPLELLSLVDDLLDVLAAAHDQGIIHRDIKPGNVFLTRNGQVKLLDFGVAHRHDPSSRSHVTPSGATIGTPAFMAPEQARGRVEQMDPRTDLWAVGATMFAALTGQHVHEAETKNEELLAAMVQPVRTLASVAPYLPPLLVALIDQALAYDPEERWCDARAMQAAAREVQATLIEQEAQPTSARDPLVSHEELTPPVSSYSPVTISTMQILALSRLREAKTIAPTRSPYRGWRWLGIAGAVLSLTALAWLQRRDQRPAASAPAIETVPSMTIAGAGFPLAVAASASVPGGPPTPNMVEPEDSRPTPRPATKYPVASNRTERSPGVRIDSKKNAPSTPPEAPIDPLDRRR